MTYAEKSIVPTVHVDDARRGGLTRAREALRRHIGGTFFGSGLNTTDGAARFAAEIVDVLDERGRAMSGSALIVSRRSAIWRLRTRASESPTPSRLWNRRGP